MRTLKSTSLIFYWVIIICFLISPVQAKYGGGTGEPNDPYLIYDANQMNTIGVDPNDWDKHFKLMADIDLGSYTGTQFNTIGDLFYRTKIPFMGSFDGNGYTISNFTYNTPEDYQIGLFGVILGKYSEAQIKNLTLVDPNVDVGLGGDTGALVGFCYRDCSVSNCKVIGGSIKGRGGVGALIGAIFYCNVSDCYTSSTVTATTIENDPVGGLIGINNWGEVTQCCSHDNVTSSGDIAGGLAGYSQGSISNCYSAATVNGRDFVGGLIGYNSNIIINCYSVGSVSGTGDYVSGLVGGTTGGPITASFWDIETSGQSEPWAGTGLTTAEMQDPNTFISSGWDFVGETANGTDDIWRLCNEGMEYPKLAWQFPSGDFVCPDGVNFIDFAVLGSAWLSESGDGNWNQTCDISDPNDDIINVLDLAVFVENWLAGI